MIRCTANQSDSTGLESTLQGGLLVEVEVVAVAPGQLVVLALERRGQVELQIEPALVLHVPHLRILERPLERSFRRPRIVFHR